MATTDGKVRQGYRQSETPAELVLRETATNEVARLPKAEIEAVREVGTLMPDGLAAAMSPTERRDLLRFLLDLGKPGSSVPADLLRVAHAPAAISLTNGGRSTRADRPSGSIRSIATGSTTSTPRRPRTSASLPTPRRFCRRFPGSTAARRVTGGTRTRRSGPTFAGTRTDLGSVLSGVFRGAGVTVPKGVCVRLGDRGEMAACFNPETLAYDAVWTGGFVKFSDVRHGFMDGLILDGTPQPKPPGETPVGPIVYHGFYRHGKHVVFAYRIGDVEMLDSPWVEDGKFTRIVGPAQGHPLKDLVLGGPSKWPQIIQTKGTIGKAGPYAIDTIEPPFENPWKALMFFGDHDFLPDGSAMICTMEGDVWHVTGLDATLEHVRWRRFASGLHQALGLVVAEGNVYVLGRDQITRLVDLDSDGEADFHECVSNAYITSTAGHDFICGLQRDREGRFYTNSGRQGLIRISADGRSVETLAIGFRNPDGLGLGPDGTITSPSSEGEWVPASMVAEVKLGGHYGYKGPIENRPPDLPLVYLPRGLDNSSGGQVFADPDRFGPLGGHWLHLSFGAGAWFLVLRDAVDGQPQGAIVPMPGDFAAGVHRGRMNPKDGQLYVSGMAGWGTYTPLDGCFQRVRYTGEPAQLPVGFRAFENGVLVTFSRPVDRETATLPTSTFAQAWNYRYSPSYGSQELSPSHPGVPGHDRLSIKAAHPIGSHQLFLEIPDLQPVNQLHLQLCPNPGASVDLFATVHRLASPFTGFDGYVPTSKTIAAHPILADMVALSIKPTPNPWSKAIPGARSIRIEAGKNLTFLPRIDQRPQRRDDQADLLQPGRRAT